MVVKIRNKEDLLNNAVSDIDKEARSIALDAIEEALESVDPKKLILSRVSLFDNKLIINNHDFDLKSFKRIFVVGGGKASGYMAEAMEEILKERIEDGLVIIPHGTANKFKTKVIRLHEANHPIPDYSSMKGVEKILELTSNLKGNDLIICLISGGGSSLMAYPHERISLDDKRRVTEILLKSGATINEINAVRKHLSRFKGGQLAKRIYPATLISLLLSDVVGDPLDVIASGPTVPDSSTFKDAIYVLRKYEVWEKVPESIRNLLLDGDCGLIAETPKSGERCFEKAHNIIIGNNRVACLSAMKKMKNLGLNTLFLTSYMEGEARNIGLFLGAIAKEITSSNNPIPRPAGLVVGGESTVTVMGKGKGGRNQEIALESALCIDKLKGVVVASVSTDGIDGPTEAAGAIVDGNTISRSKMRGMDAMEYLRDNNSYSFFVEMKDFLYTGPTGTNVNDLSVLVAL